MKRYISLPATGKHIPLAEYVRGVKLAKANPTVEFTHGLTTWWPTTGEEIMRQFRSGMHDRITQGIPYSQRGVVK
jgi:hypothetical protein